MSKPFIKTLANGLRIVCVEMPHLHSVELAVYIKAGGRNDPPKREGLSHFLEHMLFRGTEEFRTSLAIETAFEEIGGTPNASTDTETTSYYSRVHPNHIGRGMEILASMLLRPLFEGIEIEKRIITEEALEDLNEQGNEINPDTIASRMLWPKHPLGQPTIGTLESIAAIKRLDLEEHLHRFYVPDNALLVVAGALNSNEVFAAAADIFGNWQRRSVNRHLEPLTKRQLKPQLKLVDDSDSQMSLQLAFLGVSRSDKRFMAVRLLRRILAGGGSSRLHLKLREELGIVYSVEGAIGAYDETGCLAFDLSTAPENLLTAIKVTLAELKRIACEPVDQEELERIRQSYIFDLDYSRDSASEMTVRYGWGELMGISCSIEQDQQNIKAVTTSELQQTASELFTPERLNLVAVGPWKRGMKKQVAKLLEEYRK